MPPAKKYKDFESALQRLDEITQELESGDTALEKSIDLYSEGLEIAKFCTGKLSEAEKKIRIISETGDSALEEDFNVDEEGR